MFVREGDVVVVVVVVVVMQDKQGCVFFLFLYFLKKNLKTFNFFLIVPRED